MLIARHDQDNDILRLLLALTLGKIIESPYPTAMDQNVPLQFFYQNGIGIELPTQFYMRLNKAVKPLISKFTPKKSRHVYFYDASKYITQSHVCSSISYSCNYEPIPTRNILHFGPRSSLFNCVLTPSRRLQCFSVVVCVSHGRSPSLY